MLESRSSLFHIVLKTLLNISICLLHWNIWIYVKIRKNFELTRWLKCRFLLPFVLAQINVAFSFPPQCLCSTEKMPRLFFFISLSKWIEEMKINFPMCQQMGWIVSNMSEEIHEYRHSLKISLFLVESASLPEYKLMLKSKFAGF